MRLSFFCVRCGGALRSSSAPTSCLWLIRATGRQEVQSVKSAALCQCDASITHGFDIFQPSVLPPGLTARGYTALALLHIEYIGKSCHKRPEKAQKKFDFSQKNTCISRTDGVYFCCSRADQGTTMAVRGSEQEVAGCHPGNFCRANASKLREAGAKIAGRVVSEIEECVAERPRINQELGNTRPRVLPNFRRRNNQ